MLIKQNIIPTKININPDMQKPAKPITFAGQIDLSNNSYENNETKHKLYNYLLDCENEYTLNEGRAFLYNQISQNPKLNNDEALKPILNRMIMLANTKKKQILVKKIIDNEDILGKDNISRLEHVVSAVSNIAKFNLVAKILDNQVLCSNNSLISKLEKLDKKIRENFLQFKKKRELKS